MVTLRHPSSGVVVADVPMLLDTGADVTLLPQAFVEQLGIPIDSQNGYELSGFDGNLSVAPAVDAELLFESKVFKGRFLVIEQTWGVMGRNVLNNLSLLYDRAHLTWSESRQTR